MTDKSIAERESVYNNLFGEPSIANHELLPFDPHIDIYVYSPETSQRPFYTIATSGMSNERMPNSQNIEFKRIELILYAKEPKQIYIDLLCRKGLVSYKIMMLCVIVLRTISRHCDQ